MVTIWVLITCVLLVAVGIELAFCSILMSFCWCFPFFMIYVNLMSSVFWTSFDRLCYVDRAVTQPCHVLSVAVLNQESVTKSLSFVAVYRIGFSLVCLFLNHDILFFYVWHVGSVHCLLCDMGFADFYRPFNTYMSLHLWLKSFSLIIIVSIHF